MEIPDVVVDSHEVEEQIRLVEAMEHISEGHIRAALEPSIEEVAADWRSVIPAVSGSYESSIQDKVRSVVGFRARAIASTSVRRDGVFPYPAALETSPSTGRAVRRYIWQSGRLARGTVMAVLQRRSDQILQRVADALGRIVNDLVVP